MPRTVLITGASRGIGRAMAERLLQQGHRLSLGVRRPQDLAGTALDPALSGADASGAARVQLHPYEASEPASAQAWVDAAVAQFGSFDAVVHCAGVFARVPLLFEAGQEREIEQLWQVNVMGPWWLTRAAWPQLAAHGQGRVVVLVSMSGKRSKGRLAGYTASKFALMGLCQTMRNEGWEQGIRVTAICPSWVNTDMAAAVQAMPAEAMTQPGDIAALTSQLLDLPNSCVPFELAVSCNLEI
ncbi:MAG: SDR family NAD(P)-dependent oxidoreductase [Prochlorococcaceae cyanobacterium]